MIDIVFQYREGRKANQELKYAIRSVVKNFKDEHRIVIVGDCPAWLKPDLHIESKFAPDNFFPICKDANTKMNMVVLHPEVNEEFILMHDDMMILKPTTLKDFRKTYYVSSGLGEAYLRKKLADGQGSNHMKLKLRTIDALRAAGLCQDQWETLEDLKRGRKDYYYDYETHLPRLYNKRKMKDLLVAYRPIKNRLIIASLYYNQFKPSRRQLLRRGDGVMVHFHGPSEIEYQGSPSGTVDEVAAAAEGARFMNFSNIGGTPALMKWLANEFPTKTKYER